MWVESLIIECNAYLIQPFLLIFQKGVSNYEGPCDATESDRLHQRHLTWTGSRMHCGSWIQAALNVEAIRSLVPQMAVTSLDSYSLISCWERLSLSFPFLSAESGFRLQNEPHIGDDGGVCSTCTVDSLLWKSVPACLLRWLTHAILDTHEAVRGVKSKLVLRMHMDYGWNYWERLAVCGYRRIINDGIGREQSLHRQLFVCRKTPENDSASGFMLGLDEWIRVKLHQQQMTNKKKLKKTLHMFVWTANF